MTSRDFCYWLQGYFEIAKTGGIDAEQEAKIRKHLRMVFVTEIDPSFRPEIKTVLNDIHMGSVSNPHDPNIIARC